MSRDPRQQGSSKRSQASQPQEGTGLGETQAVTLQRTDSGSRERCCLPGSTTEWGPNGCLSPPGSRGSHLLNNVQQAVEVVGVAAFGQIYQQLSGQLPDLVVSILRDVGELRDDH